MNKKICGILILLQILFTQNLFSQTFNEKLTEEEKLILNKGEVVIRNIDFYKNICLLMENNPQAEEVKKEFHDLQPRYLAEIIQYKPYKGNEDLPARLHQLLYNVGDYAGIPYYSVQKDKWFNLYDSATIVSETKNDDVTELQTVFKMAPFGIVDEEIILKENDDYLIYFATNLNKLRYHDKFDCVYPEHMKIGIYLFRDGENWILYGIGGVNAPRIPFFTERIETSFINRIKTFCDYIFKQF